MSKIITDVPEGWKIQRLKRVCKLRKRTKLPPLREIANIPMALIPEDGKYATFIMKSNDDIKSGDICKEGDILLAGITPSFENGKQGIVPQLPSKYAITSTEAFPIMCDPDVETHFIFHLLKYEFTRRIIASRMEGSTGRQRVPSDVLMNFHIPVPPLFEQRGIVEVLGTVDECIRRTDAVIERAEELKRGLMQQLLTRGIGHTEYKETPLGQIPKTWKLSTFGKECNIGTGGTPRRNQSDYYTGNIPWVKSTELNYGIISDTEEHISKRALEESNAKIYPTGTLLIAMYGLEAVGTRGRCAILGVNAATNQAIAAIQPKKQLLPRFLYYYYQQMGDLIMKYAEGTKRKNLSLSIMKKIPIIVPPIKEQEKIVKIIENQDDRINIENHKMNQLNILKQGLMQSLLSGKIRVELKGDGLHRIGDGRKANN